MRPVRRYYFEFAQPGQPPIKLYALGHSPCKAKAQAYEYLETYLKASPELPPNGWRVALQDDLGIAG